MSMLEGSVKWFSDSRGFGFIHPIVKGDVVDENTEYFIHYSNIKVNGFKTLQPKQRVTFDLLKTDKGTQAVDVKPIK